MGAWGPGILDNGTACDYAAKIAEAGDVLALDATLDRVLATGTSYLEGTDAQEALAAVDIIARFKGRVGERTADNAELDKWVASVDFSPSDDLVEKARRTVRRVLTAPSEILELWQESNDFDLWKRSVEALLERL